MFTAILEEFLNMIGMGTPKYYPSFQKPCFYLIHRVLDADCDGKILRIGVFNDGKQGISIEKDKLQPKGFITHFKDVGKLVYHFEDRHQLTVFIQDNDIWYTLYTPDTNITKRLDRYIVEHYKTMDFDSKELDLIMELICTIREDTTHEELQ